MIAANENFRQSARLPKYPFTSYNTTARLYTRRKITHQKGISPDYRQEGSNRQRQTKMCPGGSKFRAGYVPLLPQYQNSTAELCHTSTVVDPLVFTENTLVIHKLYNMLYNIVQFVVTCTV